MIALPSCRPAHGPRSCAAVTVLVALVTLVSPASSQAQTEWHPAPSGPDRPLKIGPFGATDLQEPAARQEPLFKPFVDTIGDFRRLPSWANVEWLAVGLGAAVALHPADDGVSQESTELQTSFFRPGATIGSTPVQLGGAFATYVFGRTTHNERFARLGGDLIQAQLLAQALTIGVKQTVRRRRPEGGGFSFPSGHTAVSFASATVLQRHLGWKAGIPAYALASYVAASRVQMQRHYLSDVAFGMTVGIVAGRTVTIGRQRLALGPMAVDRGAGVSAVWLGKK